MEEGNIGRRDIKRSSSEKRPGRLKNCRETEIL
jgi:hypothetical protein